jgi:hypothetical protein
LVRIEPAPTVRIEVLPTGQQAHEPEGSPLIEGKEFPAIQK